MIEHHPDDDFLVEYASGSLALALSLSVSCHLQFCLHCRKRVDGLNKLGGAILNSSVEEKVQPDAFSKIMQRIKESGSSDTPDAPVFELHPNYRHDPMMSRLPKIAARLLPKDGKLKWRRVSGELKTARLVTGQDQYEVAFQRITSGGEVVEHDHRGLEVTLVLHGSFSDGGGVYNEGDFIVRKAGDVHRPTATQNQDCLCLSITEAPVFVTGLLGKFINPFLRIHPG